MNKVKSAAALGILGLITSLGLLVEKITRPEQTYVAWDQLIVGAEKIETIKFKIYIDGASTGTEITGVTCTPNGFLFICQTKINNLNLTPELHSIRISAINSGGESLKSPPIEINFLVVSDK